MTECTTMCDTCAKREQKELKVNYDPAYRVDVILNSLIPEIKKNKSTSRYFIEKLKARAIFLAERANMPSEIFDEIEIKFRDII